MRAESQLPPYGYLVAPALLVETAIFCCASPWSLLKISWARMHRSAISVIHTTPSPYCNFTQSPGNVSLLWKLFWIFLCKCNQLVNQCLQNSMLEVTFSSASNFSLASPAARETPHPILSPGQQPLPPPCWPRHSCLSFLSSLLYILLDSLLSQTFFSLLKTRYLVQKLKKKKSETGC